MKLGPEKVVSWMRWKEKVTVATVGAQATVEAEAEVLVGAEVSAGTVERLLMWVLPGKVPGDLPCVASLRWPLEIDSL